MKESQDSIRRERRTAPRVVMMRDHPFAALIPGDSVVETVVTTGFLNFLNLYNSVLVVRLVLTWFPSVPETITAPLSTITDPYLNLFRYVALEQQPGCDIHSWRTMHQCMPRWHRMLSLYFFNPQV